MNDDDEFDINEMPDALARFHRQGDIPRDVVPPTGLNRETVLALDAAALTSVGVADPDDVTTVDGMPTGVNAPTTMTLGRAVFLRSTLEAIGVSPEEVPNLYVIDN